MNAIEIEERRSDDDVLRHITALWQELTGFQDGGGVACPRCFERLAREQSVFLRWAVNVEGSSEGN
jgi:hypothetical protein